MLQHFALTELNRWIDRSTSKETATKIVSTVATDQVGVSARDRNSLPWIDISWDFSFSFSFSVFFFF